MTLAFVRVLPLVLFSPLAAAFVVLYLRGIARTEREQRDALIAARAAEIQTMMRAAYGAGSANPLADFIAGAVRAATELQRAMIRAGEIVREASDAFARFGAALAEQERRRQQALDLPDDLSESR